MAEFILKHKVKALRISDDFDIHSAATSHYEVGNDMHHGAKNELKNNGVDFCNRRAWQVKKSDYDRYDYIIYMDKSNYRDLLRIFTADIENKLYSIMSFAKIDRDVADPWYTGDFEATYNDINMSLDAFLETILNKKECNNA